MIYYSIPFNREKNIGKYYNSFMELIGDDDWACFIDGDAMFLRPFFGNDIEEYTNKYPECGIFTCKTNRVGNKLQCHGKWDGDDIKYHRAVATELSLHRTVTKMPTDTACLSGVMILVKKSTWKKLGGFSETGMLGVDTNFHAKANASNEPIYIMDGVYAYHWYRGGNTYNKNHLL